MFYIVDNYLIINIIYVLNLVQCVRIIHVEKDVDKVDIPPPTTHMPPFLSNETMTCGMDYTGTRKVYEGFAKVESYPWFGRLFYPAGTNKITTAVVLVTSELAIGPAFDIDKYPKTDFRKKSKIVFGRNCSGPHIGVIDYTYSYDYKVSTHSALAIIQLDVMNVHFDLKPICAPPKDLPNADIYAMTLSKDCNKSTMRIFKMQLVDPEECKVFYRKTDLDIETMWPTFPVCAKSTSGGKCVWRNGVILVLRDRRRWRLVGVGVYGPGCETPSRFLDYGMYHDWVRNSIARIGRPAVTRLGPDHLILRRSLTKLQRFGPCDLEEIRKDIFTERTIVQPGFLIPETMKAQNVIMVRTMVYNLTLFSDVEYTCVIIRVTSTEMVKLEHRPMIKLRRWCNSRQPICFTVQFTEAEFFVEIKFRTRCVFRILAYGTEYKMIDRKLMFRLLNKRRQHPALPWFYRTFTPTTTTKSKRTPRRLPPTKRHRPSGYCTYPLTLNDPKKGVTKNALSLNAGTIVPAFSETTPRDVVVVQVSITVMEFRKITPDSIN